MNSPNNYSNPFSYQFEKKKRTSLLLLILLQSLIGYSQEINPNGYNKFYYESGGLATELGGCERRKKDERGEDVAAHTRWERR